MKRLNLLTPDIANEHISKLHRVHL